MSALFIPTARSLQSVSSETVPQQLMYKLERTGASGWAKIGTLLGVIFHSISNFVFSCHHSEEVYQQSFFSSFTSSPAGSIALNSGLQGDLRFVQMMQCSGLLSKKGWDKLYTVYVISCREVEHECGFVTYWTWQRSSSKEQNSPSSF